IHCKDDPTLMRKNRHVKKPSYAAMGSGESFTLIVLGNYNANSTLLNGRTVLVDAVYQGILNDCHSGGNVDICTLIPGIGATFTQHHTRGPEHDTHNLVIKTEAYELFERVYRHVLDENKMEGFCSDSIKLYVGLNMLNDLHLGGFDARAFIHKIEVDSLREYFRKSEHLIKSELLRHIHEGMDAYLNLYLDRMMSQKTDYEIQERYLDSQTTFTAGTAGDATYCIEEASSALLLKGNNDKEPQF
ncbi:hypothetical protein Tco_1197674, partial [Tanacetum coccineum]